MFAVCKFNECFDFHKILFGILLNVNNYNLFQSI